MARWIEEFQVTFPEFTEIMRRWNTITEQRKSGKKRIKGLAIQKYWASRKFHFQIDQTRHFHLTSVNEASRRCLWKSPERNASLSAS